MRSTKTTAGWLFLCALALATTARADEWDVGSDNDNAFTTDNTLFHGAEQVHDRARLPVAHNCGYGGLSGKAVSVEPATGFTFDTATSARPH